MKENKIAILVPVVNGEADVGPSLEALLASDELDEVDVSVHVVSNGSSDRTVAFSERFIPTFAARGWHLDATDVGDVGKIRALQTAMSSVDCKADVLMLDVRVRLHPNTVSTLLEELSSGKYDVISGDLHYPTTGDLIVRSFVRGYRNSPYARSKDLKGTCVLFCAHAAEILRAAPNVAADDRYYLSQVPRNRRAKISGARVDYYFPAEVGALLRQQARWISSNRHIDHTQIGYERNEHETNRRPYFGENPPPIADRIVYLSVVLLARVLSRIRPTTQARW